MCVATGALMAMAFEATGAGVSMYGAHQTASANAAMAKFQQEVADNNAEMAFRHAANIERQADQKRNALLLQMGQRTGEARAQYAAQGVVLGSGVVLDYEADIAHAYDLDLRNLNYSVAMEAWQTQVQGIGQATQAQMFGLQSSMYKREGTSQMIGTGLSTLGTLSMMGASPEGQAGLAKLGLIKG